MNEVRISTSLKVTAFKLDPERQSNLSSSKKLTRKRETECMHWQQMVLLPRVLEHTQEWEDKLESCLRKDLSAG